MKGVTKLWQKMAIAMVGTTAAGLCLLAYGVKKTIDTFDRIVCTDVYMLGGRKPSSYIYLPRNIRMSNIEAEDGYYLGWTLRYEKRRRLVIWRLVEMANRETCSKMRLRAVNTLLNYMLSDSDMGLMAQQCNAEAATNLARCEKARDRMFLKPVPCEQNEEELKEKMRDLMIEMSKSRHHICFNFFVSKAFPDYKTISSYFFMALETGETMKQVLKLSQDNLILSCLEALAHHCSIRDFARDLVKAGGLSVLYSCHHLLGNQPQVNLMLSKLILSVSLYQEHRQHLHVTGWLGILSNWSRGKDWRLSALSACALANLDSISGNMPVYGREVYLLHPRVRQLKPPAYEGIDVILLHGLLGGIFFTWRQRSANSKHFTLSRITSNEEAVDEDVEAEELGKEEWLEEQDVTIGSDYEVVLSDLPVWANHPCVDHVFSLPWKEAVAKGLEGKQPTNSWPMDWLAADCNNLRLIGTNYDTRLTSWLPRCPLKEKSLAKSISGQSEALLGQLASAQVGSRPMVWIAHSMGGLLLKHILINASMSDKKEITDLVTNTKAIIFLSTPHKGSPLASLSEASRFLLQTPRYVDELRMNSPGLLKLHEDFLVFLDKHPIDVTTFLETKSTKITSLNIEIQCVLPSFANPQTGDVYEIPVGHMDICKPDSKMSFIYQIILQIVLKVFNDSRTND